MFRLLRYFSITSFVSIVIVAALLGFAYRQIAVGALVDSGEANNTALAKVLANSLWPTVSPMLNASEALRREELGGRDENARLASAVAEHLQGLSVVKVRFFDMRGRTVFSTDPGEIGMEVSGIAGYEAARDGKVTSDLVLHDQAADGPAADRDILSTYIPVRPAPSSPVAAVFELHDDVTPFIIRIGETIRQVVLVFASIMLVLYAALYAIVRHADRVMRRQYRELEVAAKALRHAQDSLERRVKARTIDLARANAVLKGEIAERQLADQRVVYMAHHDALTGLPNRTLLTDRLRQAIARADRRGGRLAVLFLDLDRFKNVNDSFGHAIGDLLLTQVAERLTVSRRDEDTVARLGGDEFVISIADVSGPADAEAAAARVLSDLARPFMISGHELHADGSIGIALYPHDGDTVDILMRNADTAMYHAKESGRANYQFFSAQMTERVSRRLSTETSLRRALERNEFCLYYQPQVDLGTGRIIGAEALLRWPQEDGFLMSPNDFIPIAEDTGLIVPLGEWVLIEACAQAQAWRERHPDVRVSVNLSARQFRQKNLIGSIEQALNATQLDPGALELELTEGILMHNVEEAAQTLARLDELGVRLAIDDFGTGYSSLAYLKRFAIHVLKIDRSFVRDIGSDSDDAAIVTAIVAMARSLNLRVTAEGVENEVQATFLRSLRCDAAQGFQFGRPMTAKEFDALLDGEAKPRAVRIAA